MTLFLVKCLFAGSIFFLTLLTGLVPFRLTNRNCLLMKVSSSFASAIFMGAAMLHLLPDAVKQFAKFYTGSYPLAYLICILIAILLTVMERNLTLDGHDHSLCTHPHVGTGCFLTCLICLHSLIEGAAIGIPNNLTESLAIFVAVFAHKGSESFALGCRLHNFGMDGTLNRRLMLIFSMVTPFGIFLASYVTTLLSNAVGTVFSAVFDAVTAGTFLYLGTEHMIEGDKSYSRGYELVSLMLGVGVMAILAVYA